jgi:hypothetical protein
MKTALRSTITVALAVALMGQDKPKDIDGWGTIKWGMTLAEARSAYTVDKTESNDYWTLLTLEPIKIGDIGMSVSVGAKHGTEKISKVSMWMYFGLSSSAQLAGPQDFDTLKTLLITKYGAPANEETKREGGDRVRTILWTFPSTSIVLKLNQSATSPNLGSILLDYAASDKKALDLV